MRVLKEVTREEFYELINSKNLNVHPTPVGRWPFRDHWKYVNKIDSEFGQSTCGEIAKGTKDQYFIWVEEAE